MQNIINCGKTKRSLFVAWATLIVVWATTAIAHAQGFTIIHSFDSGAGEGAGSETAVVQGTDGNLYGTTLTTVYKVTTSGNLTTLHTFCTGFDCPDEGVHPSRLVQGADGKFYGTTFL